jgi:site-specific recombinase XerD
LISDYPKGKKDFPVPLPGALCEKLSRLKKSSKSKYIVTEDDGESFMNYNTYYTSLKRYIKEARINEKIATHGLRHSTHVFYMEAGEDMQILFAHQSLNTTRRYIHGRHKRKTRLKDAAGKIKI